MPPPVPPVGLALGVGEEEVGPVLGDGPPPQGPVSEKSSASYAGWPYQPCTQIVTEVTEAPVVNLVLSCDQLGPVVQVELSEPEPVTPM